MNLKQIQSKIQNVKETEKVSNEQQYLSYSESSDDYEYFVYKVKKGASRKGHEEAKRQSMKLMQNPIHKSNKKQDNLNLSSLLLDQTISTLRSSHKVKCVFNTSGGKIISPLGHSKLEPKKLDFGMSNPPPSGNVLVNTSVRSGHRKTWSRQSQDSSKHQEQPPVIKKDTFTLYNKI